MTFDHFLDTVFVPFFDFASMTLINVLLVANVLLIILLLIHKYRRSDLFELNFPMLKAVVVIMAAFVWLTTLFYSGITGTFATPIKTLADYAHLLNTDLPSGIRVLIELGIVGLLALAPYHTNLRLMKQQKLDRVERDDLKDCVTRAKAWAANEGQRSRQIKAELKALRAGETFIKENRYVSAAVKEEFSRIIRETLKAEQQDIAKNDRHSKRRR